MESAIDNPQAYSAEAAPAFAKPAAAGEGRSAAKAGSAIAGPQPNIAKPRPTERLISLDVFRGLTIAGMILVNNPGDWGHIYGPVGHAKWHGWTPTDLVFPFFLFIVGVAMTFSFDKRLAQGHSRLRLFEHVVRRTCILFFLGLIMFSFPDWRLIGPYALGIVGLGFLFVDEPPLSLGEDPAARTRKIIAGTLLLAAVAWFAVDFGYFQKTELRVPGVLQRIALCYLVTSVIMMFCGVWGRTICAIALIAGYWWIVRHVFPPADYVAGFADRPEGLLHDWLDIKLLGAHIYRERPDPEGLLSTMPAVATTLLGVLTGSWLHSAREAKDRLTGLFLAGNVLLVVGLFMAYWFPINKKIWTSSYVVFTAGLALHFLGMCFWLIDVKGYRRWAWPFLVFGSNAIVVYFCASVGARVLNLVKIHAADGSAVALKTWVYQHYFTSWAGPYNASLAFALAYVALWCVLMIPMYLMRIFVRV